MHEGGDQRNEGHNRRQEREQGHSAEPPFELLRSLDQPVKGLFEEVQTVILWPWRWRPSHKRFDDGEQTGKLLKEQTDDRIHAMLSVSQEGGKVSLVRWILPDLPSTLGKPDTRICLLVLAIGTMSP